MKSPHKPHHRRVKVIPPSVLLRQALKLFGSNGEYWVKGVERDEISDMFIDLKSKRKNKPTLTADELQNIVESNIIGHIDEHGINSIAKVAAQLQKRFRLHPGHIAFCSIGAICEINTPNEKKAARWLAVAMADGEYSFKTITSDRARDIIIENNDAYNTTWLMVKAWFLLASKLAKAAGQ